MICVHCKSPISEIHYQEINGKQELDVHCCHCDRRIVIFDLGYDAAILAAKRLDLGTCPKGHPLTIRQRLNCITAFCKTCMVTLTAPDSERLAKELRIYHAIDQLKRAVSTADIAEILRSLV